MSILRRRKNSFDEHVNRNGGYDGAYGVGYCCGNRFDILCLISLISSAFLYLLFFSYIVLFFARYSVIIDEAVIKYE